MVPQGIKATSSQHTAAGVAFLHFRSALRIQVADTDFLKKARERFKLGNDADTAQVQRERDDLAFYADDQWPADIRNARNGQQPQNGMPAIPARPTLVINKVKEPVRQILNQERSSDIGIELVPADDFGDLDITPDDTEIKLREGLIRRIQRESIAADARTWAFSRAVIAGRGYYLVMTRFLPGKTWDQEIYLHRIYNQASVVLDPAHEQPDGSDSEWEFMGTWVPWDRYTAENPTLADGADNPFAQSTEADFMGLTEQYPDWYKADGEQRAVRVVNYWYTEREAKTLAILDDGTTVWESDLPEGVTPTDTRTVVKKQIKHCKIGGGVHELEHGEWAGPDMPIVKVLGEELQPYDNERRAIGMIRPARSSQEGFNAMASKFVETIGYTPLSSLSVDPEAIEDFEAMYAQANTRAFPYLPYRTYDDQGRPLKEAHRPPVDPNVLPMAQGIALFDQFVKSTTAVSDPALGQSDPSVKSARHAKFLIDESRQGTSNFLDNLVRSMRYEGQVINNLLYPIYGTKPGRLVRILNGEHEHEAIRLQPPQQDGQMATQGPAASPSQQPQYALTKDANFNVIVKVSKSFDSRREQMFSVMADVISADPMQMAVIGDLLYKSMDVPGHAEMADRQRVMLAPPVQKLLAAKDKGQKYDPAAEAKMAQMAEQLQHAEAAIQELSKVAEGKMLDYRGKLEAEQMKQQAEIERLRIEAERDIQIQQMKNATAIRTAEIAAEAKGVQNTDKLLHEAQALNHSLAHEAALEQMSQEHERQQAQAAMAHAAALGDGQADREDVRTEADREHQVGMAEMGQSHALEQGQQAADLAPEPDGEGE